MLKRAITALALAGIAPSALAQFTVTLTADRTTATVGDTVTWTMWVTDGISAGAYLTSYDLNILANDDSLADAIPFETALTPLVNPTGGTVSGASILGASGGQSTILNPLGTQFGSPIQIGTFRVLATNEGSLTYTLDDGGVLSTDIFRARIPDFGGTIVHEGHPEVYIADTVTIVPTPGALIAFGTAHLLLTRRRR